ncbi:hypothetical protein PRIPAC_76678 [Pristionchus pacificus]|uniref:Uncharacterized protein n=1 Tax=Pristionchus pacificus TaxID=54126 RepID=A0A2A6BFX9_PRIPA|nr:hypothetical protein PRIPAC_76678 [Pristionchus pacificus]|eukprot:PDM64787.1 hypothetical protein PRIPAC_53043 [Pristionchus pacificus]
MIVVVIFAFVLIRPTTLTCPSCDPREACCHYCSLPAPSYSSPISPCPAHCIPTNTAPIAGGWPMSLPGLLPESPHSPIAPTPSIPLDSLTPMNHAGAASVPIVAADTQSPTQPSPLPIPSHEPQPGLPSTQILAVTPYTVVTREQSVTHSQTAPQSGIRPS